MRSVKFSRKVVLPLLSVLALAALANCDTATFSHNTALPGGLLAAHPFQDLDGGSIDTAIICRRPDGTNICLEGNSFEESAINGLFDVPFPTSVGEHGTVGTNGVRCFYNTFDNTRRTTPTVSGIDLWLVVDTSQPFDEVRSAVGNAIVEGYWQNYRQQVPLYISVIAAHTPNSIHSSARGDVFYSHHGERSTVVFRPSMSQDDFNKAKREVLVKLQRDMHRDLSLIHI